MMENENVNVKKNRKPLFYALSFLVLAICMLFTGVLTTTTQVVYATNYSDPRDVYLSNYFDEYDNLTNFYKDTNPETQDYWGGESTAIMSDGNFSISTGASLFNYSLNYITFRVQVTNLQLKDNRRFSTFIDLKKVNDGGGSSTTLACMFMASRDTIDGEGWAGHSVGIKPLVYSSYGERFGLSGYYGNIGDDTVNDANRNWYNFMKNDFGGDLVSHYYYRAEPEEQDWGYGHFQVDDENYAYITIYTTDLYSKYYVTLGYTLNEDGNRHNITTQAVSVYDILRTMYVRNAENRDTFPELNESIKSQAKEIINAPNEQEITISYLEQIGETPFATRKTKTITAPIINNILTLDNVAKVINVASIEFMQSYCDGFTYDYVTDSYVAHYRESVCLRSKDADGHEVDYFLSPNRSYWNSMIREYPEIWNIPDTQLYGYFGYTVIPNKYTLNGLWDDLFDSRSFSGSVSYFAYTDTLTQEQYDKLLGEQYNYSWLSRVWNGFMSLFDSYDGVPVSNYLFYVNDDGSDKLWIGENGADDFYDDNGAIVNDGEDLIEDLGEFFNNLFENFGTYIFGGLGAVLIIVLILWIVRSFFKTKTAITESQQAKKRKRKRKG